MAKLMKTLELLKRALVLSNVFPVTIRTLSKAVQTIVRSHCDYCDVIYHLPSLDNLFNHDMTFNYLMERIEKVQYQAALTIAGAGHGGSNRMRLYETIWDGKPFLIIGGIDRLFKFIKFKTI